MNSSPPAEAIMDPAASKTTNTNGSEVRHVLGTTLEVTTYADLARRCIELGFMISIHTSVTHPKALQLADVVRATPLEYLVVETDSPYGAPQRYRGKRNEPAYVAEAVLKIAEIKGAPADDIAETTTQNALRLLGLGAHEGARS